MLFRVGGHSGDLLQGKASLRPPAFPAARDVGTELHVEPVSAGCQVLRRIGSSQTRHCRPRIAQSITEFALQISLHAVWIDRFAFTHRPQAALAALCGNRPIEQPDLDDLPSLRLLASLGDLFLARLEDTQRLSLRIGIHTGDGAAERQRLIALEAEPLRHDSRPKRQNRGTIDFNIAAHESFESDGIDCTLQVASRPISEAYADRQPTAWVSASNSLTLSLFATQHMNFFQQ